MIPSDHFVMFYNEVFKFLVKKGPKELDRYYQRVADRQANFTLDAFRREGLAGVRDYYKRIRIEENCDLDIIEQPDCICLRMNRCPSLSKALDSDAGACPRYCDHCPGWCLRVLAAAGIWDVYDMVSRTEPVCVEWYYTDRALARKKYEELVALRGPDLVRTNLDTVPPFLANKIADSQRFEFFHPNVKTAFEFLRKTDLRTLKLGRNEVDGDNVFVNVMRPKLTPFDDKDGQGEAHRAYMDIHVPIIGKETVGTHTLTERERALPFNEKDDYVLFKAQGEPVEIVPGEFIMFFPPYGGHRPNCTRENPPPKDYLKAVVKVRMS